MARLVLTCCPGRQAVGSVACYCQKGRNLLMVVLVRPSSVKRLSARVSVVVGGAFASSPSLATAKGRSLERSRGGRVDESPGAEPDRHAVDRMLAV